MVAVQTQECHLPELPMAPNPGTLLRRVAMLAAVLSAALPTCAWPWGAATHHYIAQNYSKHLPAMMDGLRVYDSVVDQKVNDPDIRRSTTPGEAPRHFIDIDNYSEFLAGAMPHDRAFLEATYGATFVEDNGIVPWAVGEVVTTLTQQFQAHQWTDAATTIADLCHYVGDATQPLHCTRNYDGQYTGNSGIHSRYETTMMSNHIADLHTSVMPVAYYANVVDALFGIVSGSWNGVNTVLQADNTAKSASGGSFNTTYYTSLWNSTQTLTRTRIDSATVATASFVYTAWVDAGRPIIPGSSVSVGPGPAVSLGLQAGPIPFRGALSIQYSGKGPVRLEVFDVRGTLVERIVDRAEGSGSASWRPRANVGPGIYFLRLTSAQGNLIRRVARIQ